MSTAARQMRARILQLVMDSFMDQFYGKALDCVKVLRQEANKVNNNSNDDNNDNNNNNNYNKIIIIIIIVIEPIF